MSSSTLSPIADAVWRGDYGGRRLFELRISSTLTLALYCDHSHDCWEVQAWSYDSDEDTRAIQTIQVGLTLDELLAVLAEYTQQTRQQQEAELELGDDDDLCVTCGADGSLHFEYTDQDEAGQPIVEDFYLSPTEVARLRRWLRSMDDPI